MLCDHQPVCRVCASWLADLLRPPDKLGKCLRQIVGQVSQNQPKTGEADLRITLYQRLSHVLSRKPLRIERQNPV